MLLCFPLPYLMRFFAAVTTDDHDKRLLEPTSRMGAVDPVAVETSVAAVEGRVGGLRPRGPRRAWVRFNSRGGGLVAVFGSKLSFNGGGLLGGLGAAFEGEVGGCIAASSCTGCAAAAAFSSMVSSTDGGDGASFRGVSGVICSAAFSSIESFVLPRSAGGGGGAATDES